MTASRLCPAILGVILLAGCMVGPKYQRPSGSCNPGVQGTAADFVQRIGSLEEVASDVRCAARKVVGDLRRSSVECSGRAGYVLATKI